MDKIGRIRLVPDCYSLHRVTCIVNIWLNMCITIFKRFLLSSLLEKWLYYVEIYKCCTCHCFEAQLQTELQILLNYHNTISIYIIWSSEWMKKVSMFLML